MTTQSNGTGGSGGPTSGVGPSASGGSSTAAPSSPSAPSTPVSPSTGPTSSPTPSGLSASPAAPGVSPSGAATPAAPGVEAAGDPFDFSSLFEPSSAPVAAPVTSEVPAAAPPVAAPQVPPVAPAAEATPPVQVPQAPVAATSQQGGSPPLDPADPAGIAANLLQNEAAVVDHIAANMFSLTPQEVEALEGDAVAAIPRLMAKAYVRSQHNMLTHLAKTVPLLIQRHMQVSQRNSESETKFYGAWPNLNRAAHGELVTRLAQTYRKLNPASSFDQMVRDVGVMACQAAGVPFVPGQPGTGGVRPVPPQPFQPAGASMGPAAVPTNGADENPWGFLAPGAGEA